MYTPLLIIFLIFVLNAEEDIGVFDLTDGISRKL
jgi:hypothetical protein